MGIGTRGPRRPGGIMDIERIHTPVHARAHARTARARPRSADGAVLVDATLGMGGHAAAFLERFPNSRSSDSIATPTRSASPASDSRSSATVPASCTRSTTASRDAVAVRGIREVARRALRPRRVIAAARPRRARVRLLEGRAARHAHGLDERPHRGRRHRRVERGRAAPHLPRLRRGEARRPLRARDRARAGPKPRSPARPSSSP